MPAPVASGGSGRRVGLAPTGKAPPCHGARGELTFPGCPSYDAFAPIPAVRMTTGSARVDPKPTSTAAGHGLLTALTLTAMGRLPKVLLAIKSADRRARRR